MTEVAEVWCAECDQPSLADFTVEGETVALCVEHIAKRFPSELYTESELRLMWGDR